MKIYNHKYIKKKKTKNRKKLLIINIYKKNINYNLIISTNFCFFKS